MDEKALSSERFSAKEILLQLSQTISTISTSVQDIRERVIRLEAQDTLGRISTLAEQNTLLDRAVRELEMRMVKQEANAGFWSKGLNILVSVGSALAVIILGRVLGIGG